MGKRKSRITREKNQIENQKNDSGKSPYVRMILDNGPLLIIIIVASLFLLSNLGNHYLWQDEAETALIGNTILSHGLPLGYDGKNSFSQRLGKDYGKNYIWKQHPWFQFYAVAASFSLLGANTFSARLPFALFGIATIILTYFLAEELLRSKRAALIAAGLLTASVPFLLLCRQCRYYSASALFFVLGAWSYLRFVKQKTLSFAAMICAATLLFHSFYPYCIVLMISVAAHASVFHRDKLKQLFYALLVIAVINFPWFLWFTGLSTDNVKGNPSDPLRIASLVLFYGKILGSYVFTPWLFLLVLFLVLYHYLNRQRIKLYSNEIGNPLLLIALLTFGTIGIFSLAVFPFFRYFTPLIPILCIAMALIIDLSFRIHSLVAVGVLALLVWMQPLNDFFYEITHDYRGPVKGIVRYLNDNGKESDIVLVTNEDLPLKFYTKMRVMGGSTGENLDAAKNADWIIIRKHPISIYEPLVRQFIQENIALTNYEPIPIDYPDIPFENRESPNQHYFRTVQGEDRVVLYKKIR